MNIGCLIKEIRKSEQMTQRQLASAANVARCHLVSVENNHYIPSIKYLKNISKALSKGDDTKYREYLLRFMNVYI